SPALLQPAVHRAGRDLAGRRVADGGCQHQHVHVRDSARLHPHGERGGSVSNLYAFLAARHHKFPEYKEKGLSSIRGHLVMFTSDQVPFFVNATSGTTVLGAFDPLVEIADICQKHDMWLHVDVSAHSLHCNTFSTSGTTVLGAFDPLSTGVSVRVLQAAWGGGLLFSKKYRHPRLTGIERADSVTWNPHKLMGTLLQCSTVHFKYEGILLSCNAMSAEYLFMTDKIYDERYDTGDKVIQCGRHNDIFKLWLQWRGKVIRCGRHNDIFKLWLQWRGKVTHLTLRHQRQGYPMPTTQRHIQAVAAMARQGNIPHATILVTRSSSADDTTTYSSCGCNGVARYLPKQLRDVCAKLKGRMMQSGTLMVGYQPDDRRPNFFR
ncbi:Glutamate decarboxylase, partial [Operophtera brumata]